MWADEEPEIWRKHSISEATPLTSRCSATVKLFFQVKETPPRQILAEPHICSRIASHQSCFTIQRNTTKMFICTRWNLDLDWDCCERSVVQGGVIHTTRGFFSRRSSFNLCLSRPLWWDRSHSSDCTARQVHQATSLLHSANCQKYSRPQQSRLGHDESPSSKDRPLHHQDSQLTKWGILINLSQFPLDFESVMSVVWSRQQEVQRTFGTTVSIAVLVSQVRSEGALCECHEVKANFDATLSQSCVLCIQDSWCDQFCHRT